MKRVPIRVRLALAFAFAMAAVLVGIGLLLHARLGSSLDEAINSGLEARLADATVVAAAVQPRLGDSADPEESFAQVLATDGTLVDATSRAGGSPVLSGEELTSLGADAATRVERETAAGLEGRARLLAVAVTTPQGRRVVVVGASLHDRDEALQGLRTQLYVVGPLALVLASLLGYGIATAALRPVDAMRAEAAGISAAEPGRRLPVPPARDEISRLADTLNAMLDRLEAALERERGFVADASHELRTPLAVLQAELELALRRPRSAAELEEALRSAAAETDRVTQLAEALLVLARSDQGQLALRREQANAREIVDRVAARFAGRAAATGRSIAVHADDGVIVSADVPRLEQALGNLVANALEHGGGAISLTAAAHDGKVELHVLDEGPGFPPAFVTHAFERFSRADLARSRGGAGLGLAIVDAIARAHGGSAHIASSEPGGADVWLAIP